MIGPKVSKGGEIDVIRKKCKEKKRIGVQKKKLIDTLLLKNMSHQKMYILVDDMK